MQLFHAHCSEQTSDHHVDVGLHLLKGYVHSLLRGPVQEILDTTDIWRMRDRNRGSTIDLALERHTHIPLKVLYNEGIIWSGRETAHAHRFGTNIKTIAEDYVPYSLP